MIERKIEMKKRNQKMAKKMGIFTALTIMASVNFISWGETSNLGENSQTQQKSVGRNDSYTTYLEKNDTQIKANQDIEINIQNYVSSSENVEILDNFEGESKVVQTEEEGYIEWEVDVPEEGFYNVLIEYYPVPGRSSQIERELSINGQIPFFDAGHILLSRIWGDEKEITQDNRGNDIRPRQVEKPRWESTYFQDGMGYYIEPYKFYFDKGKNTIRLTSIREPLVIKSIELKAIEEVKSYEELAIDYETKGYKKTKGHMIKVQGEDAQYKSDPTLYAISDRSSPSTEPYHPSKIRMNMIGEEQWKAPGQWIEWEIAVPEDGLYEIVLKQRQNMLRGSFANRSLTIDGKSPFKEMQAIPFKYQKEWELTTLGNEERPYLFYLTEGVHRIRLEVTLGELGSVLNRVEQSIYELNEAYRNILMLTGSQPDLYRDYQIDKRLPKVMEILETQSQELFDVVNQLIAYTGKKDSNVATIERLANQMEEMVKKPETVPERLSQFKNNVASLGTWILSMRDQPLGIDYLLVKSPDSSLAEGKVSWWDKIVHETRAFMASFVEDYNTIGNQFDTNESLDVWVLTGRDQAQIIKMMIDDHFTPDTGIGVNIRLVDPSVLLPATISGNGPDVAMQVGVADPVNYAVRNAVVDLTQFEDFDVVKERFQLSAVAPYSFNGGIYALPETQEFPMLFYRTDILGELGLEIPKTWDEVIDMLATIQKKHMNFGIPVSSKGTTGGLTSYAIMLYQRGGTLYSEDGSRAMIDNPQGVEAFETWTKLFVNYKLPFEYDFANRFRTGEIPIGIASYSMYNQLSVFAPEIRGLWEFAPIPGIMQADGTINRASPGGGTASIMLKDSKNHENAWEYMKWWTEDETQVRFGREMESLMGAAARYPTANKEALARLPWPVKDYTNLTTQWESVIGIPEVPGGYFTPRHLDNAFRKVVYSKKDSRETILDYTRVINEELDKKRKEFGLPSAVGEGN